LFSKIHFHKIYKGVTISYTMQHVVTMLLRFRYVIEFYIARFAGYELELLKWEI
jgi:hypothetical protein